MSGEGIPVGFETRPGELLCDFCAREAPCCYYPVEEFELRGGGVTWRSGTRFYACPACRELIDRDDYDGLAARCRIPRRIADRIWTGFRLCRTGPAVDGVHPDEASS
jgi:hypothetical protein